MPASLRLSRHGDNETSQVPGPPAPHLPCSPTPTGPPCQAVSARRCCPRYLHDEGPSDHILSRLNHTASAVAVYASSPGSPPTNARLASGCRLRSAEWDWLPTEWLRKVSNAYFPLSPFPRLDLARVDDMPRFCPAFWAAFRVPLEESKRRYVTDHEPIEFRDLSIDGKPFGREIGREYILGRDVDSSEVRNKIHQWLEENQVDSESYRRTRSQTSQASGPHSDTGFGKFVSKSMPRFEAVKERMTSGYV